ncbi:MAG: hypothetical protein KAJ19_09920, partial [Gammaproteobacteria bacterium]|nr:hypothetical protein [Gammaproteobacteria bacterium]
MLIVTSVDNGQIFDTYWCRVCDTYFQEQQYHQDDAGDMGDVKAADPPYWEELRIKIEGATPEVVLDLLASLYKATTDLVRMIPEQLLPDYQPALDSLEEVEANVLKVIPAEDEKA